MSAPRPCDAVIDLQHPARSERVRWFEPPWRTVWIYRCPRCGSERRLFASVYRGSNRRDGHAPMLGGMRCGSLSAALANVQQP